MNIKFTGACVDTTTDKRGTLYLIIEESSTGKPVPQKVKCFGRGIADAARAVRIGDMVHVEGKLSANRWEPPGGGTALWFSDIQANFIEVQPGDTKTKQPEPPPFDDGDVPF